MRGALIATLRRHPPNALALPATDAEEIPLGRTPSAPLPEVPRLALVGGDTVPLPLGATAPASGMADVT